MNYNTDVSCFMKSEFLFISLVQEYTCTKKRQEKLILFKGFLSLSVVKLELHIFINISSLFTWLAFWFYRESDLKMEPLISANTESVADSFY